MAFNNVNEFEISMEGVITGEKWVGKFKSKIHLGVGEEVAYNKRKRELLPTNLIINSSETQEMDNMAEALAMTQVRLTAWPIWWGEQGLGASMLDQNILYEVYAQVMKPWVADMKARQEKALVQAPELRAAQAKKDGLV